MEAKTGNFHHPDPVRPRIRHMSRNAEAPVLKPFASMRVHSRFDGRLTITDSQAKIVASVDLRPPGRYCGALVISVPAHEPAQCSWNSIPQDRPIPLPD